jgi:MFS family permease
MTVLIVWSLALFGAGAVNVAEIFLAKATFDSGAFGFGLLWTGTGVGYIAGGLGASSWIRNHGVGRVYIAALATFAVGIAAAGASPNVWVGAIAMFVSGVGNGTAIVANIVLIQRATPDRLRGRAFTVLMSATYAAMGVGLLVAGPLLDVFGARWVYAGAAVCIGAAALVAAAMLAGVTDEAPAPARGGRIRFEQEVGP